MTDELKHGRISLLRCPSIISTTDGGLTPLTDLASPVVRSPIELFPQRPLSDSSCSQVVKTNLLQVNLHEGVRGDEYLAGGSLDLVIHLFDRLALTLGSDKIIVLPNSEDTILIVITRDLVATTRSIPLMIDGMCLSFIKSHPSGCACTTCVRAYHQVVDLPCRIGRYEYLTTASLPVTSFPQPMAIPGFKCKLTQECGSLNLVCDLLVKWMSWSTNQSIAEYLRQAAVTGKTRLETTMALMDTWIFTNYNGQPYRVKKIWFEMTPLSKFYDKKSKKMISFFSFVELKYGVKCIYLTSPLIEAYPEKRTETCYLLPEFCFVLRPNMLPVGMHTVHSQSRIRHRLSCIQAIHQSIELKPKFQSVMNLDQLEAIGSVLPRRLSLPVSRASPLCVWSLLVIGESSVDLSLLTHVVFPGCAPKSMVRCDPCQTADCLRKMSPELDLVVVITKQRNLYATIKYVCLVECGVACQVIKPETLKRGLSDSVLVQDLSNQIGAKLGIVAEVESRLIALDFHRFGDVSIASCAWTKARSVEVDFTIRQSGCLEEEEMADIFTQLLVKNLNRLPEKPVVVVASRRGIPKNVPPIASRLDSVFAEFSLAIVSPRTDLRLFKPDGSNVPAGFCVDIPGGYYLVPHEVEEGNALPVLFQAITGSVEEIKSVVWKNYKPGRRLPRLLEHTMRISELLGIHIRKVARGRDVAKCIETSNGWKKLKSCFYL